MSDYPSPNFPIYMSPDILHYAPGYWARRGGDCGCGLMMNVTTVSSGAVDQWQCAGPSVNQAIGGQP